MRCHRAIASTLGVALGLAAMGCPGERSDEVRAYPAEEDHGQTASFFDTSARQDTSTASATDSTGLIQPGQLPTVSAAGALNWTGPGGKPFEVQIRTDDPSTANARRFGTITLRNSARERSPDLGQYPCTSCHLGRGMTLRDQRIADAHQNIKPDHPTQTGATCATCHAPDNVELLALKNGERATLDHAYRVCAQTWNCLP